MKTIILDMQSELYAKAVRRILVQELEGYQVVISGRAADTAEKCRLLKPYALLMETTGFSPWKLEERLAVRARIKKDDPDCKVLLIVDEMADPHLASRVTKAKQNGLIDAFLFTSASENYLVAVMDSL